MIVCLPDAPTPVPARPPSQAAASPGELATPDPPGDRRVPAVTVKRLHPGRGGGGMAGQLDMPQVRGSLFWVAGAPARSASTKSTSVPPVRSCSPVWGCYRWGAPGVRSGSPDGRDEAARSPSTVHSCGARACRRPPPAGPACASIVSAIACVWYGQICPPLAILYRFLTPASGMCSMSQVQTSFRWYRTRSPYEVS